jgi:selenide,water dikinase
MPKCGSATESSSSPLKTAAPAAVSFSSGNVGVTLRVAVRQRARHDSPSTEGRPIDLGTPTIKLTDLASCGGCAAKYSATRLEELLRGFVPVDSDDLLVGLAPADDAAVYRLDDERALIFTLDFFPPVVDDPGDYGAIAATNALNDVFAMGGTPLLALSIAAFPESLPVETLGAIFAAADEQVRAAGGLLAGGHTIRDEEPKYGLAVIGTVRPDGIWPKNGARPGDVLFVTKPLGTGLIMTGYKSGAVGTQQLERAVRWMKTLNKEAAEVLRPLEPNAVTDVTGFGLFGHAHEMAERSGVRIRLESERFPAIDGALDLARSGVRTSGDPRNREFAGPHVELDGAPETLAALAFDPQTAGGLLVSVPAERGAMLEAEFASHRLFLRRIGSVEEGSGVVAQ